MVDQTGDPIAMSPLARRDEVAFHRPLRLAVTSLVLVGATLAAFASILALTHHVFAQLPAFAAVMTALTVDAVMLWRRIRWAVLVTLAALAGQAFAVVGTSVELGIGVADVKVRQLQQLGFNPTAGVIINLIYSVMGFVVFCWFAVRWLNARPMRPRSAVGITWPPHGQ
jgi:hypothetical protein